MISNVNENSVFIFIGGSRILNGLYQSANINFLKKLISSRAINCKKFYMLGFATDAYYEENKNDIDSVNFEIIEFAKKYGTELKYKRISGRSLNSINRVTDYFKKELSGNEKIILWHHNLFGALIGNKLGRYFPNLYLHADLKGVAPEEELFYSDEIFPKRLCKYITLKYIEKIFLPKANSISLVSHRFAERIQKIISYVAFLNFALWVNGLVDSDC